jgi:hypothetical protein
VKLIYLTDIPEGWAILFGGISVWSKLRRPRLISFIIDQYTAAGERKWSQRTGLIVSLPHGYDGRAPHHWAPPDQFPWTCVAIPVVQRRAKEL